jgi:hypothetical protein
MPVKQIEFKLFKTNIDLEFCTVLLSFILNEMEWILVLDICCNRLTVFFGSSGL